MYSVNLAKSIMSRSLSSLTGHRTRSTQRRRAKSGLGGSRQTSLEHLEPRALLSGVTVSTVKIASGVNGGPVLSGDDRFGISATGIGDLDGDTVPDVLVTGAMDSSQGYWRGAAHVMFMNSDGTVRDSTKIASGVNGGPTLSNDDRFGYSSVALGDLDGDGVMDVAVGAPFDDTGGGNRGAVHILFLNTDGTVKSTTRIASGLNGGPSLANGDRIGYSVTALGDLDNDGVTEIAVGAFGDDTGGTDRGAVHILFLNSDGTVKSSTKIGSGLNGGPTLSNQDFFGISSTTIGDFDNDGVVDLAVGTDRGALHLLMLNSDGTVKSSTKIADGLNGGPTLNNGDAFGIAVAPIGDIDGNGVLDLAVSSPLYANYRGAIHRLLMNADGTVKEAITSYNGQDGIPAMAAGDTLGRSMAAIGDFNGDGITELVIGASGDDTGGPQRGAAYVTFLQSLLPFSEIAVDDDVSTDEDSAVTFNVLDNDADPQGLIVESATVALNNPGAGTLTDNGSGSFSYDPSGAFDSLSVGETADVSFDYQVENAGGETSTATVTITIDGVNDAPVVASAGDVSVDEGQTAMNTGTWSDIDASDSVTLSASVGILTQSTTNGTWSWSLGTDDGPGESQTVVITADDGKGGVTQASFDVTVNNVAPSSVDINGPSTGYVGDTVTFTLSASDVSDADQTADFTFQIDWDGNGSVDKTIIGPSGTTVDHVFLTGGSTTVLVNAVDKDGGVTTTAGSHTIALTQRVTVDIKPGNAQNKVNAKSQGVIPVAIYTTDDFDAATIDGSTVLLAGINADHFALEDVDGDGDLDLILHFDTQSVIAVLGIDLGSGESVTVNAELTGQTIDNVFIEGFDTIEFFQPGKGKGKQ